MSTVYLTKHCKASIFYERVSGDCVSERERRMKDIYRQRERDREREREIKNGSECTISVRSSDPFYIVTYYIKWATTSWTYSTTIVKNK